VQTTEGKIHETDNERRVRFDEDLITQQAENVAGEMTVRGEHYWLIKVEPRNSELP
jgi:hypothetical protein